ncbi:MAG: DUF6787 family protein [Chitinophagales bacterium]
MNSFFQNLKKRWQITTNTQLLVIITAFALTGSSSVYVSEKIKLGVAHLRWFNDFWLTIIKWVFIVTPVYLVLLVVIGTLLGQGTFFMAFAKKMLKGIGRVFGVNGKTES